MARRIVVINGHPDPRPERFAAALADAYVGGANRAGHQIRRIDVGALDFVLLRSQDDFVRGEPPPAIAEVQAAIRWADHMVIIFPLWLGSTPAVLKGFLEQVFRYGFALNPPGEPMKGRLGGRSARVIITMGMPALIFLWLFRAAGLRSLETGLLWICGFDPVRHTILGGVEGQAQRRERWLANVATLGRAAR